MTQKFDLSVARKAIYELLLQIVANRQPHAQQSLLGVMWKDEFDLLHLTDTPTAFDTGKYLKSTADGVELAELLWPTDTVHMVMMATNNVKAADGSAWTSVTWASGDEQYDIGTMWDSGDPTQFTIPEAGKYLFCWAASCYAASVASQIGLRIRRTSGSATTIDEDLYSNDATYSGAGTHIDLSCSAMWNCSASDVVEAQFWHNAGVSTHTVNNRFSITQQDVRA